MFIIQVGISMSIDVVFIDCDHEISLIPSKISKSCNVKPNDSILIVFDDYGLVNHTGGCKRSSKSDNCTIDFKS